MSLKPLPTLSATALSPAALGMPGAALSGAECFPCATSASLAQFGNVPLSSAQDLRFLQDRLALFARVSLWLSMLLSVVRGASEWLLDGSRGTLLGWGFQIATLLILLSMWWGCGQRRVLTRATLAELDWVVTLAVCVCSTCAGYAGVQPWGCFVALVAVGHLTFSRAVIVPSTPRRTLLLGLGSFAAFTLSQIIAVLRPFNHQTVSGATDSGVDAVLFSLAGTSLATLVSSLIYAPQEEASEARRLGQYTLEEKIGEGGMGQIYRAWHSTLRRPAAIKLMTGPGSEAALRRFEREVRLTARLTHPNTISVYDYGRTPDGRFYYAMELLDGTTLEQLVLQAGPQPPGRVIHILLQLCGALREAHDIGLIHRDIKPSNVHLGSRGGIRDVVKIFDFGLVREFENDVNNSGIDVIVGTPLYLSPEAILSPTRMDARADIYGIGAVAYFLLCGTAPFSGASLPELYRHHLHSVPVAPSKRTADHVAKDLECLILGCLAKDPAARPQSAQAVAEALRRCRDAGTWSEANTETRWPVTFARPRARTMRARRSEAAPCRQCGVSPLAPLAGRPWRPCSPGRAESWPSSFASPFRDVPSR